MSGAQYFIDIVKQNSIVCLLLKKKHQNVFNVLTGSVYTLYTYLCVCNFCSVLKRKPNRHERTCVMANIVLQQPKGRGEDWSYRRKKNLKKKVRCLKYNNLCAPSINEPAQAANTNFPLGTIKSQVRMNTTEKNPSRFSQDDLICAVFYASSTYIFLNLVVTWFRKQTFVSNTSFEPWQEIHRGITSLAHLLYKYAKFCLLNSST